MELLRILLKYYKDYNHIIYHGIILLGIVVGIIHFRKLSTGSRLFLLLLVITPLAELLGFYCAVKYRNNSPVSNSFNLIEYGIFCLAFYIDSRIRTILYLLAAIFLFSIINSIFFQQFFREQASNTALLLSFCQCVIYFLFLSAYFKRVDSDPLRRFPLFWTGLGTLLFSIVAIVAFGVLQVAEKGSVFYYVTGYARQYSNYLLYLLFLPAFLSSQKVLNNFNSAG